MRHLRPLTPGLLVSLALFFCCLHNVYAANNAGYTIVLASAPSGASWTPKKSPVFNDKLIYVTRTTVKNRPWERLNLGFFSTRKQASKILARVRKLYPGAWIKKSAKSEIDLANRNNLNTDSKLINNKPGKKQSSLSARQLQKLMQTAKTEFRQKHYRQAIRLFTAITLSGNSKYSQEALELQGLARQRNRQKAHAARIYNKYLLLYPEGDGTVRVKQRLAGLLTETRAPEESVKLSSKKTVNEFTSYGSVSQFYRHDDTHTDGAGTITTLSQLVSFADATAINRIGDIEHRFQVTADNTYDFIQTSNQSEYRLTELYYDISSRSTSSSARIGRQSLRIGSILNRFDGISAGYQVTPDIRLNLLTGLPVEIDDKTSLNDHKSFYGFIIETGTFLQHWNANIFHFKQTVDGVDDRINSGAELYYRNNFTSIFGTLDYDSIFNTVNTAYINASTQLSNKLTAHINAFVRKSPPIATSNAIIGQSTPTVEQLLQTMNIEQLHQLARDRTTTSKTVTVGGTQKINHQFQANLDVTFANTASTVASQGVPATPSTGTDFFISGQIVGNGLIINNDTGVLGFRYFNTKASDTLSLIANSRFPITRDWRIYPRFQIDIRNISGNGTQKKLRTLVKTDYRYSRKTRFDFELGYDDISNSSGSQSLGTNSLFYTMGYRHEF